VFILLAFLRYGIRHHMPSHEGPKARLES